jgi:hypothetical protein
MQTCQRCYRIVYRACQSETEWTDCPQLLRRTKKRIKTSNPATAQEIAEADAILTGGRSMQSDGDDK